jgi:hypothetical protein
MPGTALLKGMASSLWINSTRSPPPASTITADLTAFVFGARMTTSKANFSEYHVALASRSATDSAKKALFAVNGGSDFAGAIGNLDSLFR